VGGPRDAPGVDRNRSGLSKRRGHGTDGRSSGQDVVHDCDPQAPKSWGSDEGSVDVLAALLGPEPYLRARIPRTSHGTLTGPRSKHACDTPGDLGRLVEAAVRMAARVQGDRHHAVHVVVQSQRLDRPGKQCAEDPAYRQLATVLEQMDEVIHRKCIDERGRAPLYRMRTLEQHLRIHRQGRLAAGAQVEARSLARAAAQHAARGEQPPADCVETPVNLKSSHWLTAARNALNTAGDRAAEHPRSARRRQPSFLTQDAGFTMSPMDLDHLGEIRTDWTLDEVRALLALPFNDLLFHAQRVHRRGFDPNRVQVSTLLSIKTGGCPEDCAYCPQSVRYETTVGRDDLMDLGDVVDAARAARRGGATRFCMGAAYRNPKPKQLERIKEMVREVRALGLETCATLGMLTPEQAIELKEAGLDYYNHNLDTSEAFYGEIITTRTYQDRLDTLAAVRAAGMNVCCGGILGMGETELDRAQLLHTLATLPQHPESVPINQLVQVEGTPLNGLPPLDPLELVRTIATARLVMPRSYLRLSAGRTDMSESVQALCFLAGANSIFYGERLLTTPNPGRTRDDELFARLGLQPETGAAGPAA
jgi:biotin synthase